MLPIAIERVMICRGANDPNPKITTCIGFGVLVRAIEEIFTANPQVEYSKDEIIQILQQTFQNLVVTDSDFGQAMMCLENKLELVDNNQASSLLDVSWKLKQ